ncbi:leucine-rich repeat-containing protein 70 isoform X1 [Schistocerca cancellata]|uniref:leucine-rich repeat-containing protein 70 isoform X1 n=1 Tax=Schistocerca cancellata TaxID=274614 RepID=UPI002117CECF|nr:leucine-rich repeat-containing protein 70 isoform X1 [Schistocerca cancellata]
MGQQRVTLAGRFKNALTSPHSQPIVRILQPMAAPIVCVSQEAPLWEPLVQVWSSARRCFSTALSKRVRNGPAMSGASLLLVLACAGAVAGQAAPMQCPPPYDISPCACGVKKNGLDILCEFTDSQHITKAMTLLKERPSTVIFYLKLRHNSLPKLPRFVFLGLDIRHLTIHNSSLAVIEESSLSSIGLGRPNGTARPPCHPQPTRGCGRGRTCGKGLTQLDLSQNHLSLIPSAAFHNLHHLILLNLNHNRISALRARAFEGLDTLEILTLYENKLHAVDPEAFKGLEKKLKRLNLGGNELTAVPVHALNILDTLKKLEMQENRITEISEGDFAGLRSLDSLGLAHNMLKEVPGRVFSHLTLLNSLELDGNQITHIDPEAFAGLEENLQYLRLGDNNIHTVPSEALRRLHRLRHLDLRANNISSISDDAFLGFGDTITFLNLQKNDIKILPAMVFDNLNSLETLNLQNNKLTHIPEEVMEPIMDTLRVVDIMDNPLICDCELRWYNDWLRQLRDRDDAALQNKHTLCTMPHEHREYSIRNMPLDKMSCVGKNMGQTAMTGGARRADAQRTPVLAALAAALAAAELALRV